jgi:aspartate-semialdehyde dehydrogenase
MSKIQVGVLGATGMIGQRFVQLLEDHPYFEIAGLYASERSEGKKFREVLRVKDVQFKEDTLQRRIEQLEPKDVAKRCRAAFSGLPSDFAKDTESSLAEAGVAVFSNAASHRMRHDVPLLIPEVNPEHLMLITTQKTYANGGYIVTNANCSTTGLALPLKPLHEELGIRLCCVSTYQAVSGAGYPGVPSLDIMGNIVPHIKGEEEKMEAEIFKMLGRLTYEGVQNAEFDMVASCARVPVVDGHTESVAMITERKASVDEVIGILGKFNPEPQKLGLPTAPKRPIIIRSEEDRPQPLCDVWAGEPARARGMAATVGRVRQSGKFLKFWLLSHNTIRGGAGGSVINAELAHAKQLLR